MSAAVSDLLRLDQKVVVVTGASSGLGAHFSRVLHDAGATVALVARRADRLVAVSSGMARTGTFAADLSIEAQRVAIVAEILDRFGRIDVLVNNAGTGIVGAIEHETLSDFERVVGLNLTAAWHLTKLVGVGMAERGTGSVVNVSSMLALVGSSPIDQTGYVASKAALLGLTRELALQWGSTGIRVNALAPGWFPTEMTAVMEDERSQSFVIRNTPLRRMGRLDELSAPLLLLASDAGSFITGQTIVVDGGWTAR